MRLGSRSDCSTFRNFYFLLPTYRKQQNHITCFWKKNRACLPKKTKNKYENPRVRRSFHLQGCHVCTEITASFAKTTRPGGQNEAAHCSATDRGRAKICGTDWLGFRVQLKGNSPSLTNKVPQWTKSVIDFAK